MEMWTSRVAKKMIQTKKQTQGKYLKNYFYIRWLQAVYDKEKSLNPQPHLTHPTPLTTNITFFMLDCHSLFLFIQLTWWAMLRDAEIIIAPKHV